MEREIGIFIGLVLFISGALYVLYFFVEKAGKRNSKKASLKKCKKDDIIEINDPRYGKIARFDSLSMTGHIFYAHVQDKVTKDWSFELITKPNFVKCR